MMPLIKNTTLALLFSLAVVGCAKISTISTNLDPENFKHYFAPSKVAIVESESQFVGPYAFVEGVEGESCQEKPHLAAPTMEEARSEARRNAFDLGANAIVFSGCTTVKTDQCYSTLICYGKAYQVEQLSE